ncbi:MAG: sugar ABC transporter permease [Clostridiales bacterium]|nr:sugar ABC transporter permease [Clostridiales bacterium]
MSASIQGKKTNWARVFFIISFIILPTINFLIFYVYVNFDGILMAFYRYDTQLNKQWGFENFTMFFDDLLHQSNGIRLAFINTFKTFLIQLVIFPWGIVVSYFLYKKIPLYKEFRILFFLPSIINGIITVIVYKNFVSVEGPIARLVQNMLDLQEVPDLLGDPRFANTFVWIHMLWLSFPGDMIIWGGSFARIPDGVIESARIDGVNWVTELVKIILPMIWPTFALKAIMLISAVFGSSGAVFLLTNGDYDTMTFSAWQYIQIRNNANNPNSVVYNYVSAIGILVTLVSMVLVVLGKWAENKLFKDVDY